MEAADSKQSQSLTNSPTGPVLPLFIDAIDFWELRRLYYNLALIAAAIFWLVATWPHFRPAFTLHSLFLLTILGLMANACYCAAYLVDIPMQLSTFSTAWKHHRWILWLVGTLFALLIANYWIADEIYPDFR
ncbi:MAG TPA: hypothetical protein VJW94_19750 [Candidatus Acidoferrum sp.]|nr:hypothetical protein [Candidatus Acidoferrum sp.]